MDVLSSMGTCGEAMSSRSSMEIVCVPAKVAKIQDTLEARTMEEWADGLTWSQRSVRISLNRVRKITRAFHEGSEKKLAWKIKGNCTSQQRSRIAGRNLDAGKNRNILGLEKQDSIWCTILRRSGPEKYFLHLYLYQPST